MGWLVLLAMGGHLFTTTNQERITQSGVQHTEDDQMLFETFDEAREWAKQFGDEDKYVITKVQGEVDTRTGRINDWLFYKEID